MNPTYALITITIIACIAMLILAAMTERDPFAGLEGF